MTQPHRDQESHTGSPHTIRTLLVDDSPIITGLLEQYLTDTGHFEIIDVARNGVEAVEKSTALNPELIIMDINMPRQNGLLAAQEIKKGKQPPKIILLTLHAGKSYREKAGRIGVDGFCDKLDMEQTLLPAIKSVFPFIP